MEKNKGDIFCWSPTWKFCSGGEKMRNVSGHQGENERRWKKKVNTNTHDISSIKRVTCCRCAKQRQRNVQKMCCTCKVAFLLIKPFVVFHRYCCLDRFSITRFYISFEQTISIIESFAFNPGKFYILRSMASFFFYFIKAANYVDTVDSRSLNARQCMSAFLLNCGDRQAANLVPRALFPGFSRPTSKAGFCY